MNATLNKDDESEFSIFYNLYKKDENDTQASSSSLFGLNKDGEMLFRFVVQGVGISLVSIFGIIGNILSIIVLAKKKMRSPISCYLRGLAVADMVFAGLATLVVGIPSFAAYVTDMGDFGMNVVTKSKIVFMTPVFYGLAVTSLGASVLFTLAVTIERYIAVCHPFKARAWLTYKSAVYSSFGIGIFAVIFNAPRWLEYEILEVYDPETKELTGYRPIPSQFRMNPIYDTYVYISYTIIMIAVPVVTLIVLNILIYRAVRRANRQRQRLTSSQLHENRLAMMFLVIVSFFIVFNAIQIFEIIYRKFAGVKNESVTEIECIRNFFAVFNSSINFVIYCFLGGKFQEVFLELWPPWIRNNLCCVCPNRDKRMSWNRTAFMESKNEARKFPSFLSFTSSSTKNLEDISLSNVYISHI